MGIYTRPDSLYFWMLLERPGRAGLRRSTHVLVAAPTTGQRRDQRQLAQQIYDLEIGKLAKAEYQLSTARPSIGFTEFSQWYETNVLAHHRGKAKELSRLHRLRAYLQDRLLQTFDQAVVQEYLTERVKTIKASSVNRELDDLKLVLAAAVPRYLETSPLVGFRRLRQEESEARALERPEYDRLVAACETTEERALVITGVNTMLRLGSILTLEWPHDKGKHFITLNAKVSQVLAVIPSVVREALDALPHTGKYIFANHVSRRGGGPTARYNYLIRLFHQLCDRAEVPHGRHVKGVTFHSMRHTGATFAVARGSSIKAVMAAGGWKTVPQCLKYAHALTGDVQAAAESIAGRRPRMLKLQQR